MSMSEEEALLSRIDKAIDWFKTTGTHQTTIALLVDIRRALSAPATEPRGCPTPGAVSPVAMTRDERQAAWASLRMVREAVGELFGPLASIESDEAVLLRGPEYQHEAEAIIAALKRISAAPLSPGAVAVKALEWTETGSTAYSIAGMYQIGSAGIMPIKWYWCLRPNLVDRSCFFDTFHEARAAAQSDYEARIRSALFAHPVPALGEVGRPDVKKIVTDCFYKMREAGESHNMCARWISEQVNAAFNATIMAQAAELERVRAEFDSWREAKRTVEGQLLARTEAAEAEVSRLRETLERLNDQATRLRQALYDAETAAETSKGYPTDVSKRIADLRAGALLESPK